MVNPDDERATINVKGVAARAWERAKTAALKQDETMGVWLSRAIDYRADAEAGPREFPPANPAPKTVKPEAALAAEQLADLMRGMAALATATSIAPAKADIRRVYRLADDLVRDARGMPPRKLRIAGKAGWQSLLENGKAGAIGPDRRIK